MFCGKDELFGAMNREHFVPRCLWAGDRPQHTIVLPAHVTCNAAFSDDNNYFRDILVMDVRSGGHPEAQRVLEGPIQRKFEKRFGQVKQTLKGLTMRPAMTKGGVYIGYQPSFQVDADRFGRVLKNIVKGIVYKVTGHPVRETTVIHWWDTQKLQNGAYDEIIPLLSNWMSFGDDVFACRYLTDKTQPEMMICEMLFYRSRLFFAEAIPVELAWESAKV
jgi:hypothetical protein